MSRSISVQSIADRLFEDDQVISDSRKQDTSTPPILTTFPAHKDQALYSPHASWLYTQSALCNLTLIDTLHVPHVVDRSYISHPLSERHAKTFSALCLDYVFYIPAPIFNFNTHQPNSSPLPLHLPHKTTTQPPNTMAKKRTLPSPTIPPPIPSPIRSFPVFLSHVHRPS